MSTNTPGWSIEAPHCTPNDAKPTSLESQTNGPPESEKRKIV